MTDKRSSIKEYRAVKILSKAYMEEKEINSFRNEVGCMAQMKHPNIMKMHHYYEDPKRYLLITDICKGGDLFSLIEDKRLNAKEGAILLKQVLSAIDCMHQLYIVHRDLKPENILLETAGDIN
jgi:serine/threonine protein kinase